MAFTCKAFGETHTHDSIADCRDHWRLHNDYEYGGVNPVVKSDSRSMPRRQEPKEDGFYLVHGKYYKLQFSRGDVPRLYAKELVQSDGKMSWVYAKGAIYSIDARDKLTAEDATEFGKVHGVCIRCHKDLTREESIKRGYGPVCADHEGWPYDHSAP